MVESADAAGGMRGFETETLDGGIRLEVMDASRPLVCRPGRAFMVDAWGGKGLNTPPEMVEILADED